MKMIKKNITSLASICILLFFVAGCNVPPPENQKSALRIKHNYIILLDLSDRLIVQDDQPERDKRLIKQIYSLFENKVKNEMYIKSRDEIKVVIAPQAGSRLKTDEFEDRLYVNMDDIKNIHRKPQEKERRDNFFHNLDTLYSKAVFSRQTDDYFGADIWKYFYEDLHVDYVQDTLTENFLFILTDGYPIVGKNQAKLRGIKEKYPDLHIVMLEASPRYKDMEWDRIMAIWKNWFTDIGIRKYTLIKRGALTKELEQIKDLLNTH